MHILGFELGGKKKTATPETTAPSVDTEATNQSADTGVILPASETVGTADLATEAPNDQAAASPELNTPEVAPVETIDPAAATDIGQAADKLAAIIESETAATGSPDVAVESADAATGAVTNETTDETFAVPTATPQEVVPAPVVESQPVVPAEQTPQVQVPSPESTSVEVPDVVAMDSDAIHEALKIPAIEAPVESAAESTPEQK